MLLFDLPLEVLAIVLASAPSLLALYATTSRTACAIINTNPWMCRFAAQQFLARQVYDATTSFSLIAEQCLSLAALAQFVNSARGQCNIARMGVRSGTPTLYFTCASRDDIPRMRHVLYSRTDLLPETSVSFERETVSHRIVVRGNTTWTRKLFHNIVSVLFNASSWSVQSILIDDSLFDDPLHRASFVAPTMHLLRLDQIHVSAFDVRVNLKTHQQSHRSSTHPYPHAATQSVLRSLTSTQRSSCRAAHAWFSTSRQQIFLRRTRSAA